MTRLRQGGLVAVALLGAWLVGLLVVRLYMGEPVAAPEVVEFDFTGSDPAAEAELTAALAALGDTYTYASTIRRGGDMVVEVEGAVAGEVSERAVLVGPDVRYVLSSPTGNWERDALDAPWTRALETDADADVDPAQAVGSVGSVTFLDEDSLNALFPSGAFGAGTPPVAATIHLREDGSIALLYLAGSGLEEIEVATILRPAPDLVIELPE